MLLKFLFVFWQQPGLVFRLKFWLLCNSPNHIYNFFCTVWQLILKIWNWNITAGLVVGFLLHHHGFMNNRSYDEIYHCSHCHRWNTLLRKVPFPYLHFGIVVKAKESLLHHPPQFIPHYQSLMQFNGMMNMDIALDSSWMSHHWFK